MHPSSSQIPPMFTLTFHGWLMFQWPSYWCCYCWSTCWKWCSTPYCCCWLCWWSFCLKPTRQRGRCWCSLWQNKKMVCWKIHHLWTKLPVTKSKKSIWNLHWVWGFPIATLTGTRYRNGTLVYDSLHHRDTTVELIRYFWKVVPFVGVLRI